MKKILLIAVLLGAMLSVTVYFVCIAAPSVFFGKGLKGSGNIVTRTIEAPAFDRIDAARAVKVVITDKTSGKIIIAADDNVMDYVVVEANGGRLTATIDKSINNLSNADVTVTVPANGSIRALDASSAAKISGDVVLNADKFAMDASSAAKIDVFGQGPILRRSRIERIENQRFGRSGLLQRGGFERIENHAERLGREVHRRPQLRPRSFQPETSSPPSAR